MKNKVETIYDNLTDITSWIEFTPGEIQYIKYHTNIIFTALKITDIYHTICIAQSNLHFLDNENLGDYAKTETSIKYIKSMHIQNSLIFYNIAVDYSWQMLWLYYNEELNKHNPDSKLYERAIRDCSYAELILGLTLKQDYKMRDSIVKYFFEKNHSYAKIRPMYNYLKHRGTFYFEGLGTNQSKMMFTYDKNGTNIDLPMVARKEMNVEETKSLLMKFDQDFVQYMAYLIQILMPSDFTCQKIPLPDMINGVINKY